MHSSGTSHRRNIFGRLCQPGRRMNQITRGFLIIIIIAEIFTVCNAGQITIDPVGPPAPGDSLTLSGTKPENTSRLGIEIFPARYWEYACRYGEMTHAKHFRFVLQWITESLNNAPFVKLVRFNPDKTQSYIVYPNCPEHILIHPYVPSGPGREKWSLNLDQKAGRRNLRPGSYIILAWDASGQILYSDTYQPNGWDTSGKYLYPATMRGNIWDLENKQECANRIFSVR